MLRRDLVAVAMASLASPAGFLLANIYRSPVLSRVVLGWVGLFALGFASYSISIRLASSRDGLGTAVAVGIIAFSYFGLFQEQLAGLSANLFLTLGVLVSVASAIAFLLLTRISPTLDQVMFAGLVAAAVLPLAMALLATPRASATPDAFHRDVVVVFVDGIGGVETLDDIYGYDLNTFGEVLTQRGFDVELSASASYSMSYGSIASTLEMDFVLESGFEPDSRLRPDLYRRMQGSNAFVSHFRETGFEYVHVESGWGGTRCGPEVDRCIGAPLIEETMWNLWQRTALGPVFSRWLGHSFPLDGLATLEALESIELDPGKSELLVAHILLPHPPLLVDDACSLSYNPDLDGFNVGASYFGEAVNRIRRSAYVQQLNCVERSLAAIAGNPSLADAVVVFVGDHGPDSQGQLLVPVDDWTQPMIEERMETMLAIRGCSGTTPDATINALRFVVDCVFDTGYSELALRQFLVPVVENHPKDRIVEVGR